MDEEVGGMEPGICSVSCASIMARQSPFHLDLLCLHMALHHPSTSKLQEPP